MGAQFFEHTVIATSAKIAFEMLIKEANEDYGTASYNGSINTCEMGSKTLSFDEYNKENEKKARDYIEKNNGSKWIANYIDLGAIHYEKRDVKVKLTKSSVKPVYETRYCVFEDRFGISDRVLFSSKLKKEAIEYAKKEAIKTGGGLAVIKDRMLIKGKEDRSEVIAVRKKLDKKPKDMTNVVAYHKYIFYGLASC